MTTNKIIYLNVDSYTSSTTTPFNFTTGFNIPISNKVKTLELMDIQIPIGWYNIRSPYNTFYFYQNTTALSATITPGNYTISSLSTALQTAINAVLTSATLSVTYSSTTNLLTIAINTGTIKINNSTTNNTVFNTVVCGFTTDAQSGSSITAPCCYNLNYDLYVLLSLDNVESDFISTIPTTFKIPVIVNSGNILFLDEIQTQNYVIQINNNISLSYIKITIRDRFGAVLNNNGLHWSMKLKITI